MHCQCILHVYQKLLKHTSPLLLRSLPLSFACSSVSYPDTGHSPEEYRFVILRFYPRKALHAKPGFPGVHNQDKVRIWPRTKLQRLELAVPPGPRDHLHAASAFFKAPTRHPLHISASLLKQNSASAPKPLPQFSDQRCRPQDFVLSRVGPITSAPAIASLSCRPLSA